jgi:hypothetical protein
MQAQADQIAWESSLEQALLRASAEKAVLIDFSAAPE